MTNVGNIVISICVSKFQQYSADIFFNIYKNYLNKLFTMGGYESNDSFLNISDFLIRHFIFYLFKMLLKSFLTIYITR